jgi:hypothetical protein
MELARTGGKGANEDEHSERQERPWILAGLAILLATSVAVGAITLPIGSVTRAVAHTFAGEAPLAHYVNADAAGSIVRAPTDLPAALVASSDSLSSKAMSSRISSCRIKRPT